MATDIGQTILISLNNGLLAIVSFIPKFVAGTIIFLFGIIIASLLKSAIIEIFKALNIESFLKKYGVPEAKEELNWTNILAEIVRWFVIILFLIPTAEVWGLPQVIVVLDKFLTYLPNVLVAAIIGLVGFVFAKLAYDITFASVQGLSLETSKAIASVSKWAVTIFVVLAILNQLGVASEMIRILFTGLIAMVAVAGGIAFGLGGKDAAKDIIDDLRKKLK